ncbi:MAG: hypothetical protein WD534_00250 [Phycisphaeraceae bacterium]
MSEKVEGTLVLDGMLEGRLPDDPDLAERLSQWGRFAREQGLPVTVEVAGGRFNVLADPAPIPAAPYAPEPSDFIAGLLDQLLKHFPAASVPHLFSTLRSSAWQPGEEIQTIYLIGPDGRVRAEQRTVAAQTVAPRQAMSRRTRAKLGLAGAAVALLLVGVLALVPGVRQMIAQTLSTMRPLDATTVQVEAEAFEGLFHVQAVDTTRRGKWLVLQFQRDEAAPQSLAAIDEASRQADLPRRLALEALARGYVRIEQFDENGQFFRTSTHRIRSLLTEDSLAIEVPLSRQHQLHRLEVVY